MSRKTKEHICGTYCELMRKFPSENVSVKKIISVLDINRSTFYYHFKDTQDVVEYVMSSLSEGYISYLLKISDLAGYEHENDICKFEQEMFSYLDIHRENIQFLFREKYRDRFRKIFTEQFNRKTKNCSGVSVWPYGVTVQMSGLPLDYVKFSLAQKGFDKLEFWCTHEIKDAPREFFLLSQNINATITLTGYSASRISS